MSWWIILAVSGSVLQVLLGIFCGGYFVWRFHSGRNVAKQDARLARLAKRVQTLMHKMENDVGAHQSEMAGIEGELSALSPKASGAAGELVTQIVRHILQSNERLRGRLSTAEEKMQEQRTRLGEYFTKARTDPLTGLANRRAFDEMLVQGMEQWRRGRASFGLILIDLDKLKMLNDQGGHLTGDYVLRTLGELLRNSLRAGESAARMGGDEFALLTPGEDLEKTCRRAEEFRTAVATQRFFFERRQWPVSITLGVAQIRTGDKGTDLIRRADHALVAAKRAGRNRTFFHDGQICRLVASAEKSASDADSLLQICDDLRQRVAAVVEQT
jgi:diguanylate cyclase